MAAANAALGLASGFRTGMRRAKQERLDEEERQIGLADAARQRTRQDTADARATTTYEQGQEERKYQVGLRESTKAAAVKAEADRQEELKKKLHNEGMADFFDGLLAGEDPAQLAASFDGRGELQIPKGTQYDATTGTLSMPQPDGSVRPVNVKQAREQLRRAMNEPAPAARKLTERDPTKDLIDPETGKVVVKGKPAPAKPGDRFTAAGGEVFDNVTQKFIPKPGKGGNGLEAPKWADLRAAQKDARTVLADNIGMKLDDNGIPMVQRDKKGKPILGQSEKWTRLSSTADQMVSKYQETVGAAQVGSTLAEVFTDMPSQQDIKDDLLKNDERKTFPDGKGGHRKESQSEQDARLATEAKKMWDEDRKSREQRADETLSELSKQTLKAWGKEEAPATPAAAAPTPGRTGRGAKAVDVVTPQTITGSDQKALTQFKGNPALFSRLTQTDPETGEALGVQMPDGTVYYLVGKELRSWKPQQ